MKLRRRSASDTRKVRTARRLMALEVMEPRQLLATNVYLVNTVADTASTSANSQTAGSLRQGILNANAAGGSYAIDFAIPNTAKNPQVIIQPLTPLPALTNTGTTIDATTEPNYSATTGLPLVVLDGSKLPATNPLAVEPGLEVSGGGSAVKGLVIQNFTHFFSPGILLDGLPGDVVQDCYIGTSANGLAAAGNSGDGIDVETSSCSIGGAGATARNVISGNTFDGINTDEASSSPGSHTTIQGNYIGLGADGTTVVQNFEGIDLGISVGNQIGGIVAGTGNVISGNDFDGIDIGGLGNVPATSDVIEGNFIGTDATGTISEQDIVAITNGIDISGAGGNVIGAPGLGANVISGNTQAGIVISGSTATGNVVSSNKIGTAANGTSALGNKGPGILINDASDAIIGGEASTSNPTPANIIAFNGSGGSNPGIDVEAGTVQILTNSIHDNAGGGIIIAPGANSPSYPNNIAPETEPAPVLASAQTASGQTIITGTLTVDPTVQADTTFILQFFANKGADAAGDYEGQTLIGQTTVVTDTNGNATFSAALPLGATVGNLITATATSQTDGITSEFSPPTTVVAAPTTDLKVTTTTTSNPALLGANETYTVTITNSGKNPDTNVVYTGLLDSNSTFVSAVASQLADPTKPATFDAGTITADLGTIPVGGSVTITIVVTPISAGTSGNAASISLTSTAVGDLLDATPANNTSVVTTVPVSPSADLDVTIQSSPNPVSVDGTLALVVTVLNNGPSVATNVTATDMLPTSGFDPNSLNITQTLGSGYTISGADGNVLTFDLGDIPAQSAATITIDLTPTQDGSFTDTATAQSMASGATAAVPDPISKNDTASVTTSVEKAVNLALAATGSPSPATVNQPLTFTLAVSNSPIAGVSISDASAVVVTDTLPAGIDPNNIVILTSVTPVTKPTISNGKVTIDFGALPLGQSVSATITVVPLTSATYTNTATVSDTAEINIGTGPVQTTTTVIASPADLSVTVLPSTGSASVGSPLTYDVFVTNNGPSDAPGVVIAAQLPSAIKAGATATTNQGGVTITGSLLTGALGTLHMGQTVMVTVVVTPSASTVLDMIAGVASQDFDPNPSNNIASLVTFVSPDDLVVVGAPSTTTAVQGQAFVYGFTVYNAGPSTSTGTGFTVALPANTSIVNMLSTQGVVGVNGHILTDVVGTLAPNALATVYVTVVPTSTGALLAAAAANSANFDTNGSNNSVVVGSTATNFPGTFNLSATSYAGAETAGTIPITINRTNGTLGAITVSYTTVPGTAVPGVNYQTTAGTVTFAAGQTSATVLVPVIHDNAITPNLTFAFAITGLNGGATLGAQSSALVTVINIDRDTVPPLVTSVVPIEVGNLVAGYVVDFNKAMNPATVANAANYTLFLSGHDLGVANTSIPVTPFYNAANDSVVLIPSAPLATNVFYGLAIHAATASGVSDLSGNLLSGNGTGIAANDYDALIGIGSNLNYYDSAGNYVHLATTGAQMEVVRNFAGAAYDLQLLGVNPGHATLSGSVTRIGSSSGTTGISDLEGMGAFGYVNTTGLLSPPFVVTLPHFSALMPVPTSIPLATAIGQIVPNGPAYIFARIKAS